MLDIKFLGFIQYSQRKQYLVRLNKSCSKPGTIPGFWLLVRDICSAEFFTPLLFAGASYFERR